MADAITAKIEGLEEIEKLLRKLPARVGKKHMRRAIRRGIGLVRQEIKSTAPVGTQSGKVSKGAQRPRPGRLRRLVRTRARRGKRGYIKVSLFYPTEGTSDNPKNAFYWRFVVDGFTHTSGTVIPPNDYIQRAVDSNFRRIVSAVIKETNSGLRAEIAASRTKRA